MAKLHTIYTKKWATTQEELRLQYLEFLTHATLHSDFQAAVAKVIVF